MMIITVLPDLSRSMRTVRPPSEVPYPCLDEDANYSGCVGGARCPAHTCWAGDKPAVVARVRFDHRGRSLCVDCGEPILHKHGGGNARLPRAHPGCSAPCLVCGKPFTLERSNQPHCSVECNEEALRRALRERRARRRREEGARSKGGGMLGRLYHVRNGAA